MSENMITDVEEDHYLEEFFPKPVPYHLLPLIEHRIKLLCKSDVIIDAGEIQVINTSCIIKEKSRKNSAKTEHVYAPLRESTPVFWICWLHWSEVHRKIDGESG